MQKAFTMIELIFVIVVAGILVAIALPRADANNLNEAADQVVSHIRYTQHLALQDNKFNPNEQFWYKTRWQLAFHNRTAGADNEWSYTIFADTAGTHTGNPDVSEMAINPQNPNQYLSGGYSAGTVAYGDADATDSMNLGHKYGVESVVFSGGCTTNDNRNYRISFDNFGRPMYDKLNDYDDLYEEGGVIKLILTQCQIRLCTESPCPTTDGDTRKTIAIEPETGYAHIL